MNKVLTQLETRQTCIRNLLAESSSCLLILPIKYSMLPPWSTDTIPWNGKTKERNKEPTRSWDCNIKDRHSLGTAAAKDSDSSILKD